VHSSGKTSKTEWTCKWRKVTCSVACHGPGSRRRYCREESTMLGGWEAGIALLPGEGGEDG